MHKKISEAVQRALQGTRQLSIFFKLDKIGHIRHLLEMNRNSIITLNQGDALMLMAIQEQRNWNHDNNSIVTITLGHKFDEKTFIEKMQDALIFAMAKE